MGKRARPPEAGSDIVHLRARDLPAGQVEIERESVAAIRAVCAGLPDAVEESAWVGTRWRVRKKTFAHVLSIHGGWPPAYARAAATEGPVTVLTFRSAAADLFRTGAGGPGFFAPVWFPDIVGVILDDRADWQAIAELVVESYLRLAPKKLGEAVQRTSATRASPRTPRTP